MWAMTKSDHDELNAYRRLGLSPDEIAAILDYLNDPAPMPVTAPGELAQAVDAEQWTK